LGGGALGPDLFGWGRGRPLKHAIPPCVTVLNFITEGQTVSV